MSKNQPASSENVDPTAMIIIKEENEMNVCEIFFVHGLVDGSPHIKLWIDYSDGNPKLVTFDILNITYRTRINSSDDCNVFEVVGCGPYERILL